MLQEQTIKETLPQFSSPGLIQEIAKHGKLYEFDAGDIIIDIGVPVPFVPLIIKGSLRVIRKDDEDHELLLYFLDSGQTCASSLTCCMNATSSEVEAIAEEDVTLVGIPSQKMDEWFERFPEWKHFVMGSYKARFDELLSTINSIAFTQLDTRLEKYLKEKAKIHQSNTLKTSHQDIATDLNSSREVISRLLKHMERKGHLKLSRNTIELT